ncbi:MAG TPA: flavodoxin domain-containing protein [Anaerolineae bacterium]|nr:flavodoxin domain-containing protein [Anaerolineae bacterium]
MNRILVAYATMAGSTVEVAQAVGEEIAKSGLQVDVLPLSEVKDLKAYDGVVVGGPMIMGWHRAALGFLKKHREAFRRIPLAVFVMCMSLTQTGETSVGGVPVYVDAKLPKSPQKEDHLNFRERYARLANYVQPILRATRPVKPVDIGVFGGRLEYGRLKWWVVLFVMLIIQAPAGDRRNWTAIRSWAAGLPAEFQLEAPVADGLAQVA